MHQEYEGEIREIIAKTICAKGKKKFVKDHRIRPDHRPEHILGYWVGNHQYSAKTFHDSVVINGEYEVTVWYSYEEHSKTDLCKQTFEYNEQIIVGEFEGRLEKDEEVVVCERLEPTCRLVGITGENIKLGIETAFTVEIIGEAKLVVVAYPPSVLAEDEPEENGDKEGYSTEEFNRDDYEEESSNGDNPGNLGSNLGSETELAYREQGDEE